MGLRKKRRLAISPSGTESSTESESRRIRLQPYAKTLETLTSADQELVKKAASRDLVVGNWEVSRQRVVNRRHVVSNEYPVPNEVISIHL